LKPARAAADGLLPLSGQQQQQVWNDSIPHVAHQEDFDGFTVTAFKGISPKTLDHQGNKNAPFSDEHDDIQR
jgi:hypothetical protein